eukprot:TRINITY_DN137_c3_g1_i1.p1 TRINITY_DN137_c3_g1~~TRINITY_DN137_c3_g1_i1.p1  ORF type:complete len:973 (-),score=293.44 TRINITY_DN137_c3_g1_i1:222-3101(-)
MELAILEASDESFPILKKNCLIGRERQCDVVLDAKSVSSRHAEILFVTKKAFLKDLDSTNGTFLNDAKVKPQLSTEIRNGDVIRFGYYSTNFIFRFNPPKADLNKMEKEFRKFRKENRSESNVVHSVSYPTDNGPATKVIDGETEPHSACSTPQKPKDVPFNPTLPAEFNSNLDQALPPSASPTQKQQQQQQQQPQQKYPSFNPDDLLNMTGGGGDNSAPPLPPPIVPDTPPPSKVQHNEQNKPFPATPAPQGQHMYTQEEEQRRETHNYQQQQPPLDSPSPREMGRQPNREREDPYFFPESPQYGNRNNNSHNNQHRYQNGNVDDYNNGDDRDSYFNERQHQQRMHEEKYNNNNNNNNEYDDNLMDEAAGGMTMPRDIMSQTMARGGNRGQRKNNTMRHPATMHRKADPRFQTMSANAMSKTMRGMNMNMGGFAGNSRQQYQDDFSQDGNGSEMMLMERDSEYDDGIHRQRNIQQGSEVNERVKGLSIVLSARIADMAKRNERMSMADAFSRLRLHNSVGRQQALEQSRKRVGAMLLRHTVLKKQTMRKSLAFQKWRFKFCRMAEASENDVAVAAERAALEGQASLKARGLEVYCVELQQNIAAVSRELQRCKRQLEDYQQSEQPQITLKNEVIQLQSRLKAREDEIVRLQRANVTGQRLTPNRGIIPPSAKTQLNSMDTSSPDALALKQQTRITFALREDISALESALEDAKQQLKQSTTENEKLQQQSSKSSQEMSELRDELITLQKGLTLKVRKDLDSSTNADVHERRAVDVLIQQFRKQQEELVNYRRNEKQNKTEIHRLRRILKQSQKSSKSSTNLSSSTTTQATTTNRSAMKALRRQCEKEVAEQAALAQYWQQESMKLKYQIEELEASARIIEEKMSRQVDTESMMQATLRHIQKAQNHNQESTSNGMNNNNSFEAPKQQQQPPPISPVSRNGLPPPFGSEFESSFDREPI